MKTTRYFFSNNSFGLKSSPLKLTFLTLAFGILITAEVFAQTTAFTYQGKLTDAALPASATYDFEFALFDALTGGTQIGSTQTMTGVTVANGIFTVQLSFEAAFPGPNRFLEIRVKKPADPSYTPLAPRQPVTSAPYSIRALTAGTAETATTATNAANADTLDGTDSTGFVQTNTNAFIQNQTTPQSADFNIGGTGAANILNATTQINLGGTRILSKAGSANLFAGQNAGAVNTGDENSFFGFSAGEMNTSGRRNAFFGFFAGKENTTAGGNSFFGVQAGHRNTTGGDNAFFGQRSGENNLTAFGNSFFGNDSGASNTTGAANSFFGDRAGFFTLTGSNNVFLGRSAGDTNITGGDNTVVGTNADVGVSNLSFATVIGAGAVVNSSNTVVLGRSTDTVRIPGSLNVASSFGANILNSLTQYNINGNRVLSIAGSSNLFVGASAGAINTGSTNSFVGTSAGLSNTTAGANSFFGSDAGRSNTTGERNSFIGQSAGFSNTTGSLNSFIGQAAGLSNTTGFSNSFVGESAGRGNMTGERNSFVGQSAGFSNTTGSDNSFVGRTAGFNNTTGFNNIFIGAGAGNPSTTTQVNNSMAIGAGVTVSTNNTIVLGTSSQTTRIPGKLAAGSGVGDVIISGVETQTFNNGSLVGLFTGNVFLYALNDILASPVHLCIRSTNLGGGSGGDALARCTSSLSSVNNKSDVQPFSDGLNIIKSLKPVTFKWKDSGGGDFGLNAEDVAEVAPQFVTRNAKGEVEEVRENSLNILFINAFKEQQVQIEQQQQQIKQQQLLIDGLQKLVCQTNAQAELCKEKL